MPKPRKGLTDMPIRTTAALAAASVAALSISAAHAADGLRIAAWNITFYNGGFAQQMQRIGYDASGPTGEAFAPDVILLQEMTSVSSVVNLRNHFNSAPGSPGDWVAAPTFINSSINTALIYRDGAFDFIDATLVSSGSGSPNHPRNVVRYDLRLEGYDSDEATFAFYTTHMKAGSGSSDQARRQVEALEIVNDAATLPSGWHYVLGGDFNTQSSSQQSHRTLLGNVYNTGPFRDPITQPGSWQNNSSFRVIHTQDPAGQMDDRYDMILVSPSLVDDAGAEYIGDFPTPFNLSRWDDPNHSYRALGNDGSTYNARLRTAGNASVSAAVAQDLITTSGNSGHVPVYFDVVVPAVTTVSATTLDLGGVALSDQIEFDLDIGSGGDTARWGNAIEFTQFTIQTGPGITADLSAGVDFPGGDLATIGFTFDASAFPTGDADTFIDVLSNDAGSPTIRVDVTATVADPACSPADLAAPAGVLDLDDIDAFVTAFLANDPAADLAAPVGIIDLDDTDAFIAAFLAGCP
ncbi:MAG: GC-type dockerin domain-anchored protein [Planctomycetota bacterium]